MNPSQWHVEQNEQGLKIPVLHGKHSNEFPTEILGHPLHQVQDAGGYKDRYILCGKEITGQFLRAALSGQHPVMAGEILRIVNEYNAGKTATGAKTQKQVTENEYLKAKNQQIAAMNKAKQDYEYYEYDVWKALVEGQMVMTDKGPEYSAPKPANPKAQQVLADYQKEQFKLMMEGNVTEFVPKVKKEEQVYTPGKRRVKV